MEERKKKFWRNSKATAANKELKRLIGQLRENVVIVEGKGDIESLKKLNIVNTYSIVGKIDYVCNRIKEHKKAIILTDLDRKGNLLAKRLEERLWSMGIKTDTETRRKLGRILKVKYFENLDKRYEEFIKGDMNG